MSDKLEQIRRANLCVRLLEMGARAVVASHLSGIPKREAVALYEAVNGERPPRGMLPSSTDWFFGTEARRVESSLLALLIHRLMQETRQPVNNLLADAFITYEKLVGKRTEIDINRAWSLARLLVSKQVKLVPCETCCTRVLALSETPRALVDCPSCSAKSE